LSRTLRDLSADGVYVPPQSLGLLAMGSGAARDLGLNILDHLAQLDNTLGDLAHDVIARHVRPRHSWRAQPQECDDLQAASKRKRHLRGHTLVSANAIGG
jgi:hypothetical protein